MSFDEDIRSFEVSEDELNSFWQDVDRGKYNHLEILIASGDKKSILRFINQNIISEKTFRNVAVEDGQNSPLVVAARNGRYDIARYLLDAGLDFLHPRETPPVHCAALEGHLSVVQLLAGYGFGLDDADHNGDSPLFHAASRNQEVVIRFLVESGCDVNHVNHRKDTILHKLVRSGSSIDTLECIFSKGFSLINFSDIQGCTPLIWSLMYGRELHVITFLLSKGANVWVRTKLKQSAFQIAVNCTEDVNILRALYNAGASPEWHSSGSMSPLVIAVKWKKLNYVRFLVKELNVTIDRYTTTGQPDSFMMALRRNRFDIALFLLQAGYNVAYFQRLWFKQNIDIWESVYPEAIVTIETLSYLMSNPRSLQGICARFVRQRLGHDVFSKSQRLQIPSTLVDCIRLEHL